MFPVRYEYHLHIKKYSYPHDRSWRFTDVFLVKYEHHLHVRK
jgi:hypothetical protein